MRILEAYTLSLESTSTLLALRRIYASILEINICHLFSTRIYTRNNNNDSNNNNNNNNNNINNNNDNNNRNKR